VTAPTHAVVVGGLDWGITREDDVDDQVVSAGVRRRVDDVKRAVRHVADALRELRELLGEVQVQVQRSSLLLHRCHNGRLWGPLWLRFVAPSKLLP
jgi:hypothetical protein